MNSNYMINALTKPTKNLLKIKKRIYQSVFSGSVKYAVVSPSCFCDLYQIKPQKNQLGKAGEGLTKYHNSIIKNFDGFVKDLDFVVKNQIKLTTSLLSRLEQTCL